MPAYSPTKDLHWKPRSVSKKKNADGLTTDGRIPAEFRPFFPWREERKKTDRQRFDSRLTGGPIFAVVTVRLKTDGQPAEIEEGGLFMNRKRDTKSGAGKIVRGALFVVLLILLLGSCEQMFTFSPLSWAQRDPSNLSDAQKIAYAEGVLGSGDTDAMADAYNAIKDSSDPDVQYLASQLAVGASGLNEAVQDALADFDEIESGSASINDYLNTINDPMLQNAVDAMALADGDPDTKDDITQEDYLVTAAAILIINNIDIENEDFSNAGFSNPNKTGTWQQQTAYYLQEAGFTTDDLNDIVNLGS